MSSTHASPLTRFVSNAPFASSALVYFEYGYRPIPLWPNKKNPILAEVVRYRTTLTREEVEAWTVKWPEANVGLLCTDLAVIDIDIKQNSKTGTNYRGFSSLQQMIAEGLDLTGSPSVGTASGGAHRYFRSPHVFDKNNHLDGIDLKALGHVVAAPSVVDGKPYTLDFLPVASQLPSSSYLDSLLLDYVTAHKRNYDPVDNGPDGKDVQDFTKAFQKLGLQLHPGQHTYRCVFHKNDSNPSLSIHRENMLYHCHSCEEQGGLASLLCHTPEKEGRNFLGIPTSVLRQPYRANSEKIGDEGDCPDRVFLHSQSKTDIKSTWFSKPCEKVSCPSCGPGVIEAKSTTYARRFESFKVYILYTDLDWEGWENWTARANYNNWLWGRLPGDGRNFLATSAIGGLKDRVEPLGPAGQFQHEDLKRRIAEALEEKAWSGASGHEGPPRKKSGPAFRDERAKPDPNRFVAYVKDFEQYQRIMDECPTLPAVGSRTWIQLMIDATVSVPELYMRGSATLD
jgi:hypothetical protein